MDIEVVTQWVKQVYNYVFIVIIVSDSWELVFMWSFVSNDGHMLGGEGACIGFALSSLISILYDFHKLICFFQSCVKKALKMIL